MIKTARRVHDNGDNYRGYQNEVFHCEENEKCIQVITEDKKSHANSVDQVISKSQNQQNKGNHTHTSIVF